MTLLTSLPPEVLLDILAYLPLRSLLSFGQASKISHQLASCAMHRLSLGIFPTRLSGILSRLSGVSTLDLYSPSHLEDVQDDTRIASIVIPDAATLNSYSLLAFHNALISAVLSRYAYSLRDLDLTIWMLTPPIAKALGSARGLKRLRLRVENPFKLRGGLRAGDRDVQRRLPPEKGGLWDTFPGSWHKLEGLMIDGSIIGLDTLQGILKGCGCLKELWLKNCPNISGKLVEFLANDWNGAYALEGLGLANCGIVHDDDLEPIIHLTRLKLLSLYDCRGLDNDNVNKINKGTWKIRHLILSDSMDLPSEHHIIEVDPAYMSSEANIESSSEESD
ncbi:hypothetical protein P152DRAFT_455234 [Eremomyces bilateralis CBS 781.70]|uniref:F-box domain-containing protein n=1 Tax=Eremomyces bilateralis CBS 781.70 TaxID=1392243 RepID=A0A6G1GC94_9PEZI|nr:uncharacterized protein P152DRAFT_455234 [Eremomyces bilateralis CBS 781.70]KAF1815521.1 hypothetical protein P152DRAFT_455234 [Eremomyces bilateralis CBS 781.70]